jgi:hypothetical protein
MGEKIEDKVEDIVLENGGNKKFKDKKSKKVVTVLALLLALAMAAKGIWDTHIAGISDKINKYNGPVIEYLQPPKEYDYRLMAGKAGRDDWKEKIEIMPDDKAYDDGEHTYIIRKENGKQPYNILTGETINPAVLSNCKPYTVYDLVENEDIYREKSIDGTGKNVVVFDLSDFIGVLIDVIPQANQKLEFFRQQLENPGYKLTIKRSTGNVGEQIEVLPTDIPIVDYYYEGFCIMRLENGKQPYDILTGKKLNATTLYNGVFLDINNLIASNDVYYEKTKDANGKETVAVDLGSLSDVVLNTMKDVFWDIIKYESSQRDKDPDYNKFPTDKIGPDYKIVLERATGNVGEKIEVIPYKYPYPDDWNGEIVTTLYDMPIVNQANNEFMIVRMDNRKPTIDILTGKKVGYTDIANSKIVDIYDLVGTNAVYSERSVDQKGQKTAVVNLGSLEDYIFNIMPEERQ